MQMSFRLVALKEKEHYQKKDNKKLKVCKPNPSLGKFQRRGIVDEVKDPLTDAEKQICDLNNIRNIQKQLLYAKLIL